jgi:lipid-binding SYLF domain-containing protein
MRGNHKGFAIGAVVLVLTMLATLPTAAAEGYSKQQQLVDKAKLAFDRFAADPSIGWSPSQAKSVKAILIVPQFLKGAFGLGVAGGGGVFLMRDEKTGQWSHPAFFTVGAVSFGLQVGGSASEMVVVIKKTTAAESFYSSSFKIGGDMNVAAGPAGIGMKGWTRLTFGGGHVGYLLSNGIFAGISAEGVVAVTAKKSNEAYYGAGTRPTDILVTRTVSNPGAGRLRAAVAGAMQ